MSRLATAGLDFTRNVPLRARAEQKLTWAHRWRGPPVAHHAAQARSSELGEDLPEADRVPPAFPPASNGAPRRGRVHPALRRALPPAVAAGPEGNTCRSLGIGDPGARTDSPDRGFRRIHEDPKNNFCLVRSNKLCCS